MACHAATGFQCTLPGTMPTLRGLTCMLYGPILHRGVIASINTPICSAAGICRAVHGAYLRPTPCDIKTETSQVTDEVRSFRRIDEVERLLATCQTLAHEGVEDAMLFVTAVDERADVTIRVQYRSPKLTVLSPWDRTCLVPASPRAVPPRPHGCGQRSPLHRRFDSPRNSRRVCSN